MSEHKLQRRMSEEESNSKVKEKDFTLYERVVIIIYGEFKLRWCHLSYADSLIYNVTSQCAATTTPLQFLYANSLKTSIIQISLLCNFSTLISILFKKCKVMGLQV